jgi:pyruvate dehydrogenase E1 component
MNAPIDPAAAGDPASDVELREWLDSLDWVIENGGSERVLELLRELQLHAQKNGVQMPFSANTPYINTIPVDRQPAFPGSREIERRIKSIVRWNAMAMVVRANRESEGIGGHISTFASAATLYEIGFNHFFRARAGDYGGDQIYFQGHASPGIYARAYVEGRLSERQLENFRRELADGGGLSSYPHPWLMPNFWEFPTVSMGLGPIMAIYQSRFNRYLEDRGLKPANGGKVWAFLGDGETDEPETLGAITLPAREKLDNLVFVINCNLQRLDGPVRGNGHIIQELESAFRGAGWNVIKVIWGGAWDPLLAEDANNLLVRRMEEVVDGQYQKYTVESGDYIRQDFFGVHPELLKLVEHLSDEQLQRLPRGGHDPEKVYAAFRAAAEHEGQPTVILAQTIKGYGLGEAGEGKNITHSQKKLNEDELRQFRSRFGIPISDDEIAETPFYRPAANSQEMIYLHQRREGLGGPMPARQERSEPLPLLPDELFAEYSSGSGDREISTTMAFVHMLRKMLRDKTIGDLVVPIVPDEARTFGMDPLFRQCGIYSHVGQRYEPVDSDQLSYYKEATDGQLFEEGITEAGSMSTFIAAGIAYATHGINTIPFFVYYSMFGFQRIGDLIWAAADMRVRGFLLGATSGRTTLNGEGLQHEDGHSHVLASTVPSVLAYDPSFGYEIAAIIRDGIRRMYTEGEAVFYYLTLGNENYRMPEMPKGVEDGILKGLYRFRKSKKRKTKHRAHLFGSGAIMTQVLAAQELLEEQFGFAADVWSVTSYGQLRRDGLDCDRWNRLHPEEEPRVPYVTESLAREKGVVVAASDYMKVLPDGINRWVPQTMVSLGTDGFGRSETRETLRDHFEVDHRHIAIAALSALKEEGKVKAAEVAAAITELGIDPEKLNPHIA